MYPTTLNYSTAIQSNARACTIRGVVGGHSFDAGDVLLDSYSYTNQLCPATEVTLGGVYIGKLALTFTSPYADSLNIRNSWRGLTISIEEGIELADGTFEYIPINTFTVSEATGSDKGLAIVAYENMTKFDKAVPFDTTTTSPLMRLTEPPRPRKCSSPFSSISLIVANRLPPIRLAS